MKHLLQYYSGYEPNIYFQIFGRFDLPFLLSAVLRSLPINAREKIAPSRGRRRHHVVIFAGNLAKFSAKNYLCGRFSSRRRISGHENSTWTKAATQIGNSSPKKSCQKGTNWFRYLQISKRTFWCFYGWKKGQSAYLFLKQNGRPVRLLVPV